MHLRQEVEAFAPEGPKLLHRGDYFYLITAVGGTAGPPTGHMVIAARSKSIHGPWEHCPHNPLVKTWSADEPWWSRGHATLVERNLRRAGLLSLDGIRRTPLRELERLVRPAGYFRSGTRSFV